MVTIEKMDAKGGVMRKDVTLRLATQKNAELIHQMKYEAFLPLYEKYRDDETSPAKEGIEKVIRQLKNDRTDYYLIMCKEEVVGAVRVYKAQETENHISPLFVLPEHQNKGIAYTVIQLLFQQYEQAAVWRLDTILQEKGNCYLYEKCGFHRIGEEHVVNEKMTLIDYERMTVTDCAEEIRFYEELSLNSHPAMQTNYYDGWLLRFGNGYTARANSVNMLYPSTIDLQTKIKVCEEQYFAKQLPCIFKIIEGRNCALDEMLQKRGYKVVTPTDFLVMDITKKEFPRNACIITNEVTDEWLHAYFKFKKFVDCKTCDTVTQILQLVQNETLYCRIEQDGISVACAYAVIERGYVFIGNVIVNEEYRGKGYGQQLCENLLAKAKEQGAHTAYLQVVQNNQVAYNLYRKLGYQKVYSYWYRKKD